MVTSMAANSTGGSTPPGLSLSQLRSLKHAPHRPPLALPSAASSASFVDLSLSCLNDGPWEPRMDLSSSWPQPSAALAIRDIDSEASVLARHVLGHLQATRDVASRNRAPTSPLNTREAGQARRTQQDVSTAARGDAA